MSATALLEKNSSPTDDEINDAMKGNICRCGTYVRIKSAIKSASASMVASALFYDATQTEETPV
jgi:aerobic-type carbon monoxide dehydrogenase small subunit (CoxS/CutS family)